MVLNVFLFDSHRGLGFLSHRGHRGHRDILIKIIKNFLLEVWNKLKLFFTPKSKMEINTTVDKWFDETFKLIRDNKPTTEVDILISGALLCASTHTKGTLKLIDSERKLSAQALLRVLCELYIKLLWCFGLPKKLSKEDIHKRFQRWDYSRLSEHKKLLLKLKDSWPGDSEMKEALEKVESGIEIYKSRKLKQIPDVAGIFGELSKIGGDWLSEVYPKIYQLYSRAIHSDMSVIREIVKLNRNKNIIEYRDDILYSVKTIKEYCVSMAHDINFMIRSHYKDDNVVCYDMKKEYDEILSKVEKN